MDAVVTITQDGRLRHVLAVRFVGPETETWSAAFLLASRLVSQGLFSPRDVSFRNAEGAKRDGRMGPGGEPRLLLDAGSDLGAALDLKRRVEDLVPRVLSEDT